MFGYLQPYKPYLLVKDYELYKSVYCGLCKTLGEEYSIFARFALSYDCTCYALLAMGLNGKCENVIKKHCVFNPMKKCTYCTLGSEELKFSAAITVIILYYKLEDNIKDNSFIKGIPVRILKIFVSHWRKKAMKIYPEIEKIVSNLNKSQYEVEKLEKPTIDMCAEPTAVMMRELVKLLAKDETEKIVFSEFGYFLGRWIYLMDAVDDYEKDIKKCNFNPFVFSEKCKNFSEDERAIYINSVLNDAVTHIVCAYNLMNIESFGAITENLVTMGLGQMQKKVIFDKKEKA